MDRSYIAIDLKSFYASVECVERHLDPLTTNLVVADPSRTEKTICLAVSPSLKAHGIGGRARLFEVVQRVEEINRERLRRGQRLGALPCDEEGRPRFAAASFDAEALEKDPSLELSYITAPPRMKLYEEYSTKVFGIYLRYVSAEDIHVYSVDECFIDATAYLKSHKLSAHEFAMVMIRDVLYNTGITATAGIGTNLYLAKVAMDIVAKHVPGDKDGVRIASLDEMQYRRLLWAHQPLTDFWRVGHGYARKLESLGLHTMGDVALASLIPSYERRLYETFGINAELLIDHAWGREPVTIADIHAYRPSSSSLSMGQVLSEPSDFERGELIVREMAELLVLDLVRKGLMTKQLVLTIGYDRSNLQGERGSDYSGAVRMDHYGRRIPAHAHGTENLPRYSSSSRLLVNSTIALYRRIVDPSLLIRRVNLVAAAVSPEDQIPEEAPEQLDLFSDPEQQEAQRRLEKEAEEKEKRLQQAALTIQARYGKNALLKGMNLQEGATTIERNRQIGGHKAE